MEGEAEADTEVEVERAVLINGFYLAAVAKEPADTGLGKDADERSEIELCTDGGIDGPLQFPHGYFMRIRRGSNAICAIFSHLTA